MESLIQLKETAEVRVLNVIKILENLENAYGIEKIKEAVSLLQEVRTDLLADLSELS